MYKIFYKYIAATALIAGFSSCDESGWESTGQEGMGSLELSSLSIEVNNAEKVISRATVNVSDFMVTIIKPSTQETVGTYTYGDMPEILTLPAGETYQVKVESHEIQKAEWDKPYFKGESDPFQIESAKITKVGEITAYFASLKVTIKFADDLKKLLGPDAQVAVKGTNGAELIYTPQETRPGYFAIEGSTTFAAHFSGTIDGTMTTSETAFKEIEAGQHHILTYSLKNGPEIPEQSGQIGGGDVDLDINYEVKDVNSNTQVDEDVMDPSDRPGKEDPQEPDEPEDPDDPGKASIDFVYPLDSWLKKGEVMHASEFDKELYKAYIEVHCTNPISEFWVNIESEDPSFKSSLEDDFNLKTNFDLADTSEENQELLATFGSLGFPTGEEVRGQKDVKFDITEFVGLLVAFDGQQTFTLTVKDDQGNSKSDTIRIIGNE